MKPIASLSLDLDNQWSYMKTHGDPGWEAYPSYLDKVVPRFLHMLDQRDLKITVFIVGQDAARPENHAALASIAQAGHEIGNHSFHHEPWLHLYSIEQIEAELATAEEHITRVTGYRPRGFRGPGFSLSESTLRVLSRRGYVYDGSTFPTYLGPLARAYYFMTAKLSPEEKRQRALLFGGLREGFRPLRPYQWNLGDESLVEIPVTTLPLFKVPIHVSYLLYLGAYSRMLALSYFSTAMHMCKVAGIAPSLLLHPLDFLGCDDGTPLNFFPAMNLTSQYKLDLVGEVLDRFQHHFRVLPMLEHAQHVATQPKLVSLLPRFRMAG
jgi:hypothetical protein